MEIQNETQEAQQQNPSHPVHTLPGRFKPLVEKWGVSAAVTFIAILWLTLVAATWSSS